MRRSARAPSAAAWPDAIDVEDGSCDSSTEYIDKYEKHDAAAAASCSSDAAIQYSLLALGLFTRYYSLLWPRQVVFDEVHFGKFVNGYITGRYFFDIHPPLGKQLIALVAWSAGYDGSQPFDHIGEVYRPHVDLFVLRAVPAFFGALLVPLTHRLVRRLGCSQPASLLAAGIVLLDGAALVCSRLLVTDALMFFFELLQLYGMLLVDDAPINSLSFHLRLALTGLAIGCAISIKWTALATMAMVGLHTIRALFIEALQTASSTRSVVLSFFSRFAWLFLLPLTIYILSFVAHLWLLPYTGPGDQFHDLPFRCRLTFPPRGGSTGEPLHGCDDGNVEVLSLFGAILALNKRMLTANAGIRKQHSFGSGWLAWPLNSKPVFYWKLDLDTHEIYNQSWCRIYLAGNPVAWYLCLFGLVLVALSRVGGFVFTYWRKPLGLLMGGSRRGLGLANTKPMWQQQALPLADAGTAESNEAQAPAAGAAEAGGITEASQLIESRQVWYGWLLLIGHLISWVPFAWVHRVAFLYHYIPALLISVLATALAFDALTSRCKHPRIRDMCRVALASLLLAAILASSLYFMPLYLGWPLHPDEFQARLWRLEHLTSSHP